MMTIKISKESMERFNHDKNVADICNATPCPINNGADLKSDALLENLFDDGEYIENKIGYDYVALGFIGGVPARCSYILGNSFMWIAAILKKKKCNYDSWKKILPERLSDEQVYADLTQYSKGYWQAFFYYYN